MLQSRHYVHNQAIVTRDRKKIDKRPRRRQKIFAPESKLESRSHAQQSKTYTKTLTIYYTPLGHDILYSGLCTNGTVRQSQRHLANGRLTKLVSNRLLFNGWEISPKVHLSVEGSGLLFNTRFLGTPRVHMPKAISTIDPAVFSRLTVYDILCSLYITMGRPLLHPKSAPSHEGIRTFI